MPARRDATRQRIRYTLFADATGELGNGQEANGCLTVETDAVSFRSGWRNRAAYCSSRSRLALIWRVWAGQARSCALGLLSPNNSAHRRLEASDASLDQRALLVLRMRRKLASGDGQGRPKTAACLAPLCCYSMSWSRDAPSLEAPGQYVRGCWVEERVAGSLAAGCWPLAVGRWAEQGRNAERQATQGDASQDVSLVSAGQGAFHLARPTWRRACWIARPAPRASGPVPRQDSRVPAYDVAASSSSARAAFWRRMRKVPRTQDQVQVPGACSRLHTRSSGAAETGALKISLHATPDCGERTARGARSCARPSCACGAACGAAGQRGRGSHPRPEEDETAGPETPCHSRIEEAAVRCRDREDKSVRSNTVQRSNGSEGGSEQTVGQPVARCARLENVRGRALAARSPCRRPLLGLRGPGAGCAVLPCCRTDVPYVLCTVCRVCRLPSPEACEARPRASSLDEVAGAG